jgi:hypothetical protein
MDLHGRLTEAFGDVSEPVIIAEQSPGTAPHTPLAHGEHDAPSVRTEAGEAAQRPPPAPALLTCIDHTPHCHTTTQHNPTAPVIA